MTKNIVICSDGTGNTSVKGRGTNVVRLCEAVDLHGHKSNPRHVPQVAIYDDPVDSQESKAWELIPGAFGWGLRMLLSVVFGWGLSRNVKQLYMELASVYDGAADPPLGRPAERVDRFEAQSGTRGVARSIGRRRDPTAPARRRAGERYGHCSTFVTASPARSLPTKGGSEESRQYLHGLPGRVVLTGRSLFRAWLL